MARSTVRPRRAKPRFSAGMVVAVVATVLVVLASLVVIAATLLRPTEPEPAPTATARPALAPAPEAGAGEWRLPERRWEPLPPPDPASPLHSAQSSPLYDVVPPDLERCARPSTVETEAEWKAAVRDQWFCVHRSWVPVFQQLGWSTTAPEVRFFTGEGDDSACGYLQAPAFYCAAGAGTVHFGSRHFDMARTWDLSVTEMVNHEYGHHLQNLAGITAAKIALPHSRELERRAELQATCWSAALTRRGIAFGQEQYDSWTGRLESMQADGVHGSRESLVHWGTRGLYAATMNDCNTWVVPEANVT